MFTLFYKQSSRLEVHEQEQEQEACYLSIFDAVFPNKDTIFLSVSVFIIAFAIPTQVHANYIPITYMSSKPVRDLEQ
jgi:hypothetical protein